MLRRVAAVCSHPPNDCFTESGFWESRKKVSWETSSARGIPEHPADFGGVGNPLVDQVLGGLSQGLVAGTGLEEAGEGVGVSTGEDGTAEVGVEGGVLGDGDAALVAVGRFASQEALG